METSRFLLRRPSSRDSDRSMLVARRVQRQSRKETSYGNGPVYYQEVDLHLFFSPLLYRSPGHWETAYNRNRFGGHKKRWETCADWPRAETERNPEAEGKTSPQTQILPPTLDYHPGLIPRVLQHFMSECPLRSGRYGVGLCRLRGQDSPNKAFFAHI